MPHASDASDPSDASVTHRRAGVLALLAIALLFVLPVEGPGANQAAHFALVRSLLDYGTAKVDRTRPQQGDDVAVYRGHLYALKAPGFAFANVPGYAALRWIGMSPTNHRNGMLWALGLLTVVLPTVVLLFLVRYVRGAAVAGTRHRCSGNARFGNAHVSFRNSLLLARAVDASRLRRICAPLARAARSEPASLTCCRRVSCWPRRLDGVSQRPSCRCSWSLMPCTAQAGRGAAWSTPQAC